MTLRRSEIESRLEEKDTSKRLFIIPRPDLENPAELTSTASVDLRLGTWFLISRHTRIPLLETPELSQTRLRLDRAARELGLKDEQKLALERHLSPNLSEPHFTRTLHVRFGRDFILHPRSFALAVTLEWIRMPEDLAGYVTCRSSWGRRGLVIATAVGVHPGFTGCLTLELTNVGDLPIAIRPGLSICQLFLHKIESQERITDTSGFACKRKPALGTPKIDRVARALAQG